MRSTSRCAKFGIMVFKASMLSWQGGRSAKFGVMVFKASMLDWGDRSAGRSEVNLPNLSSRTFRCGHHRGLFASLRPISLQSPNTSIKIFSIVLEEFSS